jgi:hypothetical protein
MCADIEFGTNTQVYSGHTMHRFWGNIEAVDWQHQVPFPSPGSDSITFRVIDSELLLGRRGMWQEELDLLRHHYKETGAGPTVLARTEFPRKSRRNIRRDSSLRPQTDSFASYLRTMYQLQSLFVVGCYLKAVGYDTFWGEKVNLSILTQIICSYFQGPDMQRGLLLEYCGSYSG